MCKKRIRNAGDTIAALLSRAEREEETPPLPRARLTRLIHYVAHDRLYVYIRFFFFRALSFPAAAGEDSGNSDTIARGVSSIDQPVARANPRDGAGFQADSASILPSRGQNPFCSPPEHPHSPLALYIPIARAKNLFYIYLETSALTNVALMKIL